MATRSNFWFPHSAALASIPATAAYFADYGTFVGMDAAGALKAYDGGLNIDEVVDVSANGFCIDKTVGDKVASYTGPSAGLDESSLCP